ncbi:ABC transporter permease [Actinacidiphila rubida]|uniref:FtsX-like permease family protein n=1 Tax=Actinacidiphila rubida TaxID=310780 RepID=A0A1H8QLS8_9ACTN|nr:ABC transporter permease [Actinacidiphila rubida]SEO54887.1 FtsX-like permease family protein [Actinacidiphila rubida]
MVDSTGVHVVTTASPEAPRRPGVPHRRRRRLPAAARRSTRHGLVLAAVAATVLLCATALAALATLAGGSVQSGTVRRLAADPGAQVAVNASYRAEGMGAADRDVRAAAARVFAGVPERTYLGLLGASAVSVTGVDGAASAPREPGGSGLHPIAVQGAAGFGRLVAGHWPAGTADPPAGAFTSLPDVRVATGSTTPVDTAVPQPLAQRLGLAPGSRLRLQDAFGRTMTLRVTGVFRTAGPAGFWPAMAGDATDGGSASQKLLVVSAAALNGSAALNGHLTVHWSLQPDYSRLHAGALAGLRDRVRAFTGSRTDVSVYRGRPSSLQDMAVSSGLPGAIDALAVPAVAARSALYLPMVMVAALALATLVVAARQVTVHRRGELALQQARGSGTLRLLRGAAAEWAVTGIPAAVAAPYLAGFLHPGPRGTGAWAAVGVTLLVHAGAVLLPVLPTPGMRPVRGARAAAAQRLGADLALLAVAVLGYAELRRHRSLIGGGLGGTAVDPVLVVVPALASGAVALLLLRLLPLTSRLLDLFARRGRGLILALAGWQLSRRAARNAGPVVLMCLAVSVSAFATTALACLGGLASEQAASTVGADVRIAPAADDGYPAAVLSAAYRALPAVTAVAPVTQTTANIPGGATEVLVGTLGGPAPRMAARSAGIALPGRPTAILLDERLRSDGGTAAPRLALTVQDAAGLDSTVSAALPAADGARHTVAVPLGVAEGGGHPRAYPLTVTAVDVLPQPGVRPALLDLELIRIGSRATTDSWAAGPPAGQVWSDRTENAAEAVALACRGDTSRSYEYGKPGVCSVRTEGSDVFRAAISTGLRNPESPADAADMGAVATAPGGDVRLVAGPGGHPAPLAVRADARTLRAGHLVVGDTTTLDLGLGSPVPARIVGRVVPPPGLGRGQGVMIADQRALASALTFAGGLPRDPAFWWISSTDSARTAAAAETVPALGGVTTAARTAAALEADPFRSGLRRVLRMVRYLAPAFAVITFTVHAVISTRQRRREFALLRAIGVRPGKLSALLSAEQLGLALFAVLPGALMGMALASAVLPLVTVDDTGQAPYPPLPLVTPWRTVMVTAVVTALAISAVVLALARVLARVDLVRVLRAGEDG